MIFFGIVNLSLTKGQLMYKFTVESGPHKADITADSHKTAATEFVKRLKITESNWSEKISPIIITSTAEQSFDDATMYFSTESLLKQKLKVV